MTHRRLHLGGAVAVDDDDGTLDESSRKGEDTILSGRVIVRLCECLRGTVSGEPEEPMRSVR
jgi:hypothetical protein